ncbi:MAG: DUF1566 domain-containing protein, partial [Deltaproteobacteria bacterium]|nr:DUF1566 domain-containing protein [Deltaproteobacteria bacterium]
MPRYRTFIILFTLVVLLCCLPSTGESQTYPAPVPKTGQITTYAAGDDGALQKGVAWPNPRFTDNNDGTVMDNLTGLIWLKNANCFGPQNWTDALSAANGLTSGSCGLTDGSHAGDWRLPNVNELKSLPDNSHYSPALPTGHPFTGVSVEPYYYWSSTTGADRTSYAWFVGMYVDGVNDQDKTNYNYVWPVRGGQSGSFDSSIISARDAAEGGLEYSGPARDATLPPAPVGKTGQTTCYDAKGNVIACAGTGQDGDKQAGVAWPSPRFIDNNDGSVTDNLTGLIWLKNANCFGPKNWTDALCAANGLTSGSCGLTDGSHSGDWRLPNVNELKSLTDNSRYSPALPTGYPFIGAGVGLYAYWSSTTMAYATTYNKWNVYLNDGHLGSGTKAASGYVWPVRGGQGGTPAKTTYDFVWAGTGGSASIWTLDSSKNMTAYKAYGPYSGWKPVNYSSNPSDGTKRTLLWSGTGGSASILTLDSSNNLSTYIQYGPYSGWTPVNYSSNP